jgi:diketogulonate reductase-like aldo/keto reductase
MEYETAAEAEVPTVGLGTWQLDDATASESVSTALELGYRHVDTAQAYGNEAAVGRAIADSDVDREEVFLTTKVHPSNRSVDDIVASVEASLDRLGTSYVDLILIHWPHPLADLETVMSGLNAVVDRDLARHLGVSNFGKDRLDRARELSDEPVLTDQVLFHPWWPQRDLLAYCQAEDVLLTAYSPLANGGAIGDSVLGDIGDRYGKSDAQVAIRWAIGHDHVVAIPMSTSRAHLADNLDVFDFELTDAERDRITRPSYLRTGWSMLRGQLPV